MQETNPKKLWDNIKLLSGLSKPPSLTKIHVDGAKLKDVELAEALNDCFTNVASDIQPLVQWSRRYPKLGTQELCISIYSPICSLFNSSINEGSVPSPWKCANVIPINKVPLPASINSDFRPIS